MMSPAQPDMLLRIERAASDEELLALVRRYVHDLPEVALERLPPHCIPHGVEDTEDIADWALVLTQSRTRAGDENRALADLEQVFARACVRASELLDRTGRWRSHARRARSAD